MYIAMNIAGMPFNGATIPAGQSLGGSETAAYYMARELVKLGHSVTVFTTHKHTNERGDVVGQYWDGVLYEWIGTPSQQYPMGDRFHMVMQAPFDVVIIQRHPSAFTIPYNSKLNIWWLHDLALYRHNGFVQQQLVNIDKIFCVSEWHKQQVSKVYDIPLDTIIATKNGVDYSLFANDTSVIRESRSLFYMARPERGLENLVGPDDPIMGMLNDCHLYVCGYDNTVPEMRTYYEMLWKRCQDLPNVTNLGALGKRQLYENMAKTMLYVYPTTFEDTSCIAALEANAAGLPVIGSQWSATPETLEGGGCILIPLKDGKVNKLEFAKIVRKVLAQPDLYKKLQAKALSKRQTWEDAAKQWHEVFTDALKVKCSNKIRLALHLEQMSDIVAADKGGLTDLIPNFRRNYAFYLTGDYVGHYARYYDYETKRGVNYGPENLAGNMRFETVAQTICATNPRTILDFGCAHGHYIMNLLPRLPRNVHITGIDIDASNIEKARKWAKEAGYEDRITLIHGSLNDIPPGLYDCIICSELLEHTPIPALYVDGLCDHLSPNGFFIGTAPSGPWEAIGYRDHPGWRSHLHHFERQDLNEMFGHMREYKLVSIPWQGIFGHLMFSFRKTEGTVCGFINYERKLAQQAPYETLSVCMIAYNEEFTIGRTLKNIREIADEIIIGIDEKTTDRTEEICKSFGAQIFIIKSPLEQGFDEARNATIAKAMMDWVLWIDADETFENMANLGRYLRANCYAGYAIKQHHYAIEPPSLFQTDLPIRLFRNHRGAKFFGHVHEHPEIEMNKGIGKVMVIEDAAIMHVGYSTEAIRRNRFIRNFPLMKRDRERYPERLLGKFLWLRDLSQFNRHLFERSGGQITQEIINNAQEGVKMWNALIDAKHLRMACDGLDYYSQCVDVLTRGQGIKAAVDMSIAKLNGGIKLPCHPVQGMFIDRAQLDRFIGLMLTSTTEVMEDRYY